MRDEAGSVPLHDARGAGASAGARALATCPYLLASSGDWRATSPSRDHRCTAFAPAAPLATEKQRRLCLVADHVGCSTYLAALAAREERGLATPATSNARWAPARMTPVVDVGVGIGATVAGLVADRRGWQVIPAVILVVALAALGLSGIGRGVPGTAAIPTASPTAAVLVPVTPSPASTPVETSASSPSPTLAPVVTQPPTQPPSAPGPTPTPIPSAQTTYRVKSGDTLYDIAIAFKTSVSAIRTLNGLTSNTIRAGQVLLIP